RVPTARESERDWKNRAITVYDVKPKQQRDLQTRLFDRRALNFINSSSASNVQRRAEQPAARQLQMFGPRVAVCFAVQLLKLSNLFFERHAFEQRINLALDVRPIVGRGRIEKQLRLKKRRRKKIQRDRESGEFCKSHRRDSEDNRHERWKLNASSL